MDELLKMHIWQMTGAQFLELIKLSESKPKEIAVQDLAKNYVYGIRGIAELFKCSKVTANRIKQSGIIDSAITQIGRKIIVDADLALQLANRGKGSLFK